MLLAESLQLPSDYFTPRHRGENVTLRFLHYPANLPSRSSTQLGAGEHTDYGSITLLFQQERGGWKFAMARASGASRRRSRTPS